MQIFHVASEAEWISACAEGSYATSTRGRSLAEEGFIHASHEHQWRDVVDRFYGDTTEPLLLLVIDTERLSAPVVTEAVADSSELFPHIYGPLNVEAVIETVPIAG